MGRFRANLDCRKRRDQNLNHEYPEFPPHVGANPRHDLAQISMLAQQYSVDERTEDTWRLMDSNLMEKSYRLKKLSLIHI